MNGIHNYRYMLATLSIGLLQVAINATENRDFNRRWGGATSHILNEPLYFNDRNNQPEEPRDDTKEDLKKQEKAERVAKNKQRAEQERAKKAAKKARKQAEKEERIAKNKKKNAQQKAEEHRKAEQKQQERAQRAQKRAQKKGLYNKHHAPRKKNIDKQLELERIRLERDKIKLQMQK